MNVPGEYRTHGARALRFRRRRMKWGARCPGILQFHRIAPSPPPPLFSADCPPLIRDRICGCNKLRWLLSYFSPATDADSVDALSWKGSASNGILSVPSWRARIEASRAVSAIDLLQISRYNVTKEFFLASRSALERCGTLFSYWQWVKRRGTFELTKYKSNELALWQPILQKERAADAKLGACH